jgi:hypothetical protein
MRGNSDHLYLYTSPRLIVQAARVLLCHVCKTLKREWEKNNVWISSVDFLNESVQFAQMDSENFRWRTNCGPQCKQPLPVFIIKCKNVLYHYNNHFIWPMYYYFSELTCICQNIDGVLPFIVIPVNKNAQSLFIIHLRLVLTIVSTGMCTNAIHARTYIVSIQTCPEAMLWVTIHYVSRML